MMAIETWFTGGNEYHLFFREGTHVIVEDEGYRDEVVFRGHYDKCLEFMNDLLENNVDYDLGL